MLNSLKPTLWLGGVSVIVAVISVAYLDAPIALFFNSHRDNAVIEAFAAITDAANGIIWYSLALLGVIFAYLRDGLHSHRASPAQWRRRARPWAFMIAAMASSGILVNVLKPVIGRLRPRFLYRDGIYGFEPFSHGMGDYTFPSGHAQSIWSAMLCLAVIFPAFRIPAVIIAFFVSASRFITGVHYVGDVVIGAFIGIAATAIWKVQFERSGVPLAAYESQKD